MNHLKNAWLAKANAARATLMRETGMDDLDYQLSILEGGCFFLDQLCRSENAHPMIAQLYREHLTKLRFWTFYEHAFRTMEIDLVEEWAHRDALALIQPPEWKRKRLLDTIKALPWNDRANHQVEVWLKNLGDARVMRVPAGIHARPETQQQPQHESH